MDTAETREAILDTIPLPLADSGVFCPNFRIVGSIELNSYKILRGPPGDEMPFIVSLKQKKHTKALTNQFRVRLVNYFDC